MSTQKPIVMVIEDEELLLDVIKRKLELSDISALSCVNGRQALDYLNTLGKLPDAIWLDYYLKDMNGLEFMQELKKNKKYSNIPVIVVSNSASPQKVNNMLALGAKQYILKAEHRLDDIISTIIDFIRGEQGKTAYS